MGGAYMSGWVKIHREIEGWEWYQDSRMVHLFVHILFQANHKEKEWRGVCIKRGQFATGLHSLSSATGISIQKIRTGLKRLKSTGEITIKSTNKFSIVTICNYERYQEQEKESNKPITINQQTNNKQITTTKNEKKEKNEKKTTTAIKMNGISDLKPVYFSPSQWDELYNHRQIMKARQTERAYNILIKEFDKTIDAGGTADDILNAMSSGKGWVGYQHKWLERTKMESASRAKPTTDKGKMAEALLRRMK